MNQSYSEKLRDPRWQKMRLEIMQRDSFQCRLCSDEKSTLNVHHLYYERGAAPWEASTNSLVTLCEPCHEYLHSFVPGNVILEYLIAGGIDYGSLDQLVGVFQMAFDPMSKTSTRFSKEQWRKLTDRILDAIISVRDEE